jgi:hypothetical protein
MGIGVLLIAIALTALLAVGVLYFLWDLWWRED